MSTVPYPCPGAGRWIGYGMASAVPWEKTVSDGVVTYVNTGERVSFDLKTGMPIVYEAGLSAGGPVKERTTFVLEARTPAR